MYILKTTMMVHYILVTILAAQWTGLQQIPIKTVDGIACLVFVGHFVHDLVPHGRELYNFYG